MPPGSVIDVFGVNGAPPAIPKTSEGSFNVADPLPPLTDSAVDGAISSANGRIAPSGGSILGSPTPLARGPRSVAVPTPPQLAGYRALPEQVLPGPNIDPLDPGVSEPHGLDPLGGFLCQ